METEQDRDEQQGWRRERLEGAGRLGTSVAALGWLVAGLGLLITVQGQAALGQVRADSSTRWQALVLPLLLSAIGVGVAGVGHLLRALPAICGMPAPESGSGQRTFGDFLQSMRAHQE